MLCAFFTIFAVIVVVSGYLLMALGIVVAAIWMIGLIVVLVASGGPGAAIYAASWFILGIACAIMFLGFFVASLGYLLLWIGSLVCGSRSSSSGIAGLMAGGGAFSLPALPGLPGLPAIDLGGLFGGASGLLGLLLLPIEQRMKLPPDVLRLVECLRGCLCATLCADASGGAGSNPGQVVVDVGKTLLEDLKAQLDEARKKLDEARSHFDASGAAYWGKKIEDLLKQIAALGG